MKKTLTMVTEDIFEIDEKENIIHWIGSDNFWKDESGVAVALPSNMPSRTNLMIHILGKQVLGKNGKDELAITNYWEEES